MRSPSARNFKMSKRVTAAEKQQRLLSHFQQHPEPFLLKELEKIGPKLYGIVEKTVKVWTFLCGIVSYLYQNNLGNVCFTLTKCTNEPPVTNVHDNLHPQAERLNTKETVEQLVSDQAIQSEKIGTSTYFFLFKSALAKQKMVLIKNLEMEEKDLYSKVFVQSLNPRLLCVDLIS